VFVRFDYDHHVWGTNLNQPFPQPC